MNCFLNIDLNCKQVFYYVLISIKELREEKKLHRKTMFNLAFFSLLYYLLDLSRH